MEKVLRLKREDCFFRSRKIQKILRVTLFLFLVTACNLTVTKVYSQDTPVSINLENTSLRDVLLKIEAQSNYKFFFNEGLINVERKVNVQVENQALSQVLQDLFTGTNVGYELRENQIILMSKDEKDEPVDSQSFLVSGKVTDTNYLPLPGVAIVIKGSSAGVITDLNGEFTISNIDPNAVLIFRFIGMLTQEVSVSGKTRINVVMEGDVIGLEEVVAIGYGSLKKKDLTGSVSTISAKDINSLPAASIGDAMQGKASGVQVISSGVPGNDPSFRIRGVGTINNNNPLLVIDGVPTFSGLNQLNMNDVESIQILKDASATAIYGSRGANGVIIVTTRNGSNESSQINFSYFNGIQKATNLIEVLNASEFASLHNEMMANAGLEQNPAYADPGILGQGSDWIGAMFSPASMQNYSLSYSGGNEKSTFYVSGNVYDQKGIVEATGFKRYSVKFNSETNVLDNVKFGNMITLNHDIKYNGDYNIKNTLLALPTQNILNDDGSYAGPQERPSWDGDLVNPYGKAKLVESTTKGYNLLGSVFSEIEIMKGLKFRSSAGLKVNIWDSRTWSPKYDWNPTPQENSYLFSQANKSITWNWDNTLSYNTTINDVHQITLMAGTSAQENHFEFMNGSIQNFASDLTQQLDNGSNQPTVNGNASEWSLMSYMSRANYAYNDKYLITATIRRDGSSRFGSQNKWGIFPSGSLAWRISEEDFFDQIGIIDYLKLRAGFGVTGNQEIGNYSFASALQTNKYNFNNAIVNAVVPNRMPNPNVQWESQKQTNIGFDATVLNQRLNITLDVYYKNTQDMLVPMSVPISTGYSDIAVPYINAGEIINRGIELSLTSHNIKGVFNWNTDFNISYNKNEVKALNDTIPMLRGDVGFNYSIARIEVGYPVDIFYGFITDGIFQSQEEVNNHALQVPGDDPYNRTSAGDIRFMDLNSDGVIDDNDRTFIGDPNPELILAMNNSFTYKGFDLIVFLQGVYGVDIFNANRIWNEGMAVAYNQSIETLDRWTGPGTSDVLPRAVFNDPNKNTRPSDRYIEDGSYLRIKNVSLGYTFSGKVIEKINLSAARIYLSGTNLFTLTSYKGFDPEVYSNGIDNSTYPVTRNISIGANLSF